MADGLQPPPPLSPHEEGEKPNTINNTKQISYAAVLQQNLSSTSTTSTVTKTQSFKPFSVNRTSNRKGTTQVHPNLVFGDFDFKLSGTFRPTLDYCGKKAILFQKSDKVQLINKIQHVLIGKFSHGRPSISAIKEFFCFLKLKGSYNISLFDSKHLYIECELSEDYIRIWFEKLWIVRGFKMRVFKWSADFNPRHESPVAPVWVYLYGLPLYLFDKDALLSIANAIGRPLLISRDNLNRSNLSRACLCVELDVTKPFMDEVWIDFGKGVGEKMEDTKDLSEEKRDGFWQKLEYGHIPEFCTFCAHIDHSLESCKQRKGKDAGEPHGFLCKKGVEPVLIATARVQGAGATSSLEVPEEKQFKQGNVEEEVVIEDLTLEEGELAPAEVCVAPAVVYQVKAPSSALVSAAHSVSVGCVAADVSTTAAVNAPKAAKSARETSDADIYYAIAAGGTAPSREIDLGAVAAGLSSAGGFGAESAAAAGELTRVLTHAGETAGYQELADGVSSTSREPRPFAAAEDTATRRIAAEATRSAANCNQAGGILFADEGLFLDKKCSRDTTQNGHVRSAVDGNLLGTHVKADAESQGNTANYGADAGTMEIQGVSAVQQQLTDVETAPAITVQGVQDLGADELSEQVVRGTGLKQVKGMLAATVLCPHDVQEMLLEATTKQNAGLLGPIDGSFLNTIYSSITAKQAVAAAGTAMEPVAADPSTAAAISVLMSAVLMGAETHYADSKTIYDLTLEEGEIAAEETVLLHTTTPNEQGFQKVSAPVSPSGQQSPSLTHPTAVSPGELTAAADSAPEVIAGKKGNKTDNWADLVEEEQEKQLAREQNDILEWDAAQVRAFVHNQIEDIKQEIGQTDLKITDAAKNENKDVRMEKKTELKIREEKQLARELKFVHARKNLKEYFMTSAEKINSDLERKRSKKMEKTTGISFKYGEG